MKKILIVGLILFAGCAGATNSSKQDTGQFDPETCKNIPLGMEEYQALGGKGKLIKCSDLERCAAYYGGQTPPNIPCE
ncbi:MAG: hypothetical protein L0Y68_04540 [Candidatus Dadabacteria bacterium]|nr:hypothetical protein [Candidatus Dadabacteria bacterium]